MNLGEGTSLSASLLLQDTMFHCTDTTNNNSSNMSVFERQMAGLKWQQQQQQQQLQHFQAGHFGGRDLNGCRGLFQLQQREFHSGFVEFPKPDPGLVVDGAVTPWADHHELIGLLNGPNCGVGIANMSINGSVFEPNYSPSRNSCRQPVAVNGGEPLVAESCNNNLNGGVSKKRKHDKVEEEQDITEKRIKGSREDQPESKIAAKSITKSNSNDSSSNNKKKSSSNNGSKENSSETSKDKSKVTEDKKPDYIHVRARRGQATDNHSLAERARREKISERMKYLQDLVPGCNKITGKAGMLDEIINYVQSLQRQVEFLSMKLAAVNPGLDFNIDSLFTGEAMNFPTLGMLSDMSHITNPAYVQFNQLQQLNAVPGHEMNMAISVPLDTVLRRTTSTPTSISDTFVDPSCLNQMQASAIWDGDLTNLYNVAFDQRSSFQSQPFTSPIQAGNLKMEEI